jgi:hypothetical protein
LVVAEKMLLLLLLIKGVWLRWTIWLKRSWLGTKEGLRAKGGLRAAVVLWWREERPGGAGREDQRNLVLSRYDGDACMHGIELME